MVSKRGFLQPAAIVAGALIVFSFCGMPAHAEPDGGSDAAAADAKAPQFWHDNRITPEQPFAARVVAYVPLWIGYSILLEEIADDNPRYCIAKLWAIDDLSYTIVEDRDAFRRVPDAHKAVSLDPEVDVNDFHPQESISFPIGRERGEDDFVAQQYAKWQKRAAEAGKSKREYRLKQKERTALSDTTVVGDAAAVSVDIESRSGIGQLIMIPSNGESMEGDLWSRSVTLRLYVRGLDMIQLDNGTLTIVSALVHKGDGKGRHRVTYVTPSNETRKEELKNKIDEKDRLNLWVDSIASRRPEEAAEEKVEEVKAWTPEGDPALREKAHIQIQVPAAFLKDEPEQIEIRWIDFYRG